MADTVPLNESNSDRIWIVGGLLGLFVYFNVRNPPKAFKGLEGTAAHHETLAHRYAARGTSRACSTRGLQALLAAQTAFVHAQESGNQVLVDRLERQRDEILERSKTCCYGSAR